MSSWFPRIEINAMHAPRIAVRHGARAPSRCSSARSRARTRVCPIRGGCANCQTHLEATAVIPLPDDIAAAMSPTPPGTKAIMAVMPSGQVHLGVVVHGRDGVLFNNLPSGGEMKSTGKLTAASVSRNAPVNRIKALLEIR
jgi:hypothetical protein